MSRIGSSVRLAAKTSKEDTDKATHFVVQWLDTDVGKFSVVPRNKVASDPPFQLGLVVLVKCSCKKGGFTTERAKIASQGTKEAMERSLDRFARGREPDAPSSRDKQDGKSDLDESDTNRATSSYTEKKTTVKGKRKKPSMYDEDVHIFEEFEPLAKKTGHVNMSTHKRKRSNKECLPAVPVPDPEDTDTDDEDANQEGDSDFLKTYKELTREESCSPIQPDPRKAQVTDSAVVTDLKEIKERIGNIEKKLELVLKNQDIGNTMSPKVQCSSKLLTTDEDDNPASPVTYCDTVLTDLPCSANSPQKYARKVMTNLFTTEEMASGLFSKVGASSKPSLSPNRTALVMKCLQKKYKPGFLSKSMPAIRESLNQKCRDLKKKMAKAEPNEY